MSKSSPFEYFKDMESNFIDKYSFTDDITIADLYGILKKMMESNPDSKKYILTHSEFGARVVSTNMEVNHKDGTLTIAS
jgi:hypothetical protein